MTSRVLIVDDELSVLSAFQYMLEDRDWYVEVAPTAQAGLMRFKQERYDVVVTDKNMPDFDGLWLLTQIRALDHNTQFVVITGKATGISAIHAANLGALEYIQKPFNDIFEVAGVIERALERSKLQPGDELVAFFDRMASVAKGKTPPPDDPNEEEPDATLTVLVAYAPRGEEWLAEIVKNAGFQMVVATTPEAFEQKLAIAKSRTVILLGVPEAVPLVTLLRESYPLTRLFVVFESLEFETVRPFIVAGASGMISDVLGTEDAATQLRRLLS